MNYPVRNDIEFDLEAVVSLETIRAHTKTLDIVTVQDPQLILYRGSAFEAAEKYTGLWLRGLRWMTESVKVNRRCKEVIAHKTKYPVKDGWVYLNGDEIGNKRQFIGEGRREVNIFLLEYGNGAFNRCCNPCANEVPNTVMYQTGFSCLADIPDGIVVGMLKYIAFNIENAGGIGSTYMNERSVRSTRLPSNDPVESSGAAAEWRRYATGSFG